MAIKTHEIKKLYELSPADFPKNLKKVFGVQESVVDYGDEGAIVKRTLDPTAASDLNNIGPAKMARDFIGPKYYDVLGRHLSGNPNAFVRRVQEADGGSISASLLTPINLWTAGVLGLYDAKVLEGYNLPEFKFRELSTEAPTIVPGGHKHIRVAYDGSKPVKPLQELEPAPTVGAAPAWIWTQACETYQIQTSLTMEAMLSDISGTLQEAAMTVGKATGFRENDRFFDVFYGRVNTYCYNGVANIPNRDTYQAASAANGFLATAAAAPFNYTNALTGAGYVLNDHLTLQQAWILLNQNYDPVTGWRFTPDRNLKLVVAPDYALLARKIKNQTGAWLRSGNIGGTVGTNPSPTTGQYRAELTGPATQQLDFDFEVVDATYIAIDRAVAASVHNATAGGANGTAPTFAQAVTAWWLGSPKAFQYQVLRPLQSNTYPLTGDEMSRRIVFRGDAMVMSRFVVVEPRAGVLVFPW